METTKTKAIYRMDISRQTYTIKETSEILGISYSYCRELINKGIIPSIPVGSIKKVPIKLLDQYIAGGY